MPAAAGGRHTSTTRGEGRLPAWRWRCARGGGADRLDLGARPRHGGVVRVRQGPAVRGRPDHPGALEYLRSRGRPLPVVLAPFAATPVNWFSGIAFELVGGAPVYAAAVSSYHSRVRAPRSAAAAAPRRRPRSSIPPPPPAERQQILDRWHVTDVAVDLKRASPQLVRQLDADPNLRRVYTDPPQSDQNYAQLAIWARE